ncbi:hypothetical protein D1007_28180 [Hordeum vulgare]|nr:hypothetical protein D1007_28180 [Hordeum vulgare]
MDSNFVTAHDTDRETVGTSRTVLPANTNQTLDESSNHTPNNDNANEDEGMPEVMSTPQQPTAMMRFDTLEDAEKHYKMYARQKGFGVRYCFRKRSEASGELIRASLVYHRAGLKIKRKVDTQNPQPIAPERSRNTTERTNCPARMFVKRRDNAWVVTEINDNHNHPLIKKWSLTGYLRSHRHIPEEEQQFVKLLHSCNLEPSRQMQLLTELHGQREDIGYTDKDLANLLAKFRAEHKYTDMQDTIEYFKSSQQLDKDFFYKFQGEMQSLLSYSCKQMGAQEYMVDCIAKFVPGYGNKSFKIMVQLGVTTLPAAYILKRWTWLADEMLVDMSSQVPGKVHEMPEESVILMKTTLMKNEFASLAKVGCRTADGRKIIGTHLKEMKRELAALAKEQKKRRSRADFAAVSSATVASAPSMSKYAAQPAHSAPIHGFNNQGRSSCGVPFEPSIMGHGATAVSTHTMSNTATPSVYTSPSAASSNNQGRSSNAAAFDPQIEGQSALLAAMSAPVMPNHAAPGVYSAQLGASTRQGHSTYVAPAEPNILGYGATATPAALGAYSARSAFPAAACAPATQPMSRSATPGVYTAQAAPHSNNKGHSSHAAAFKTQNQCQNASMTVMSESASAWPMAPATTVISTPVGGSNNQHHSSHVVAPEPIIRDPEKSNTKGRKRKKSFQHPLNIGRREKRTCRLCGSVTHDARTCLTRENSAPSKLKKTCFS